MTSRTIALAAAVLGVLLPSCAGVVPTHTTASRGGNVAAPPTEDASDHVADSAQEIATDARDRR